MRTIVDLPDEQIRALDAYSKKYGVSRAEAVRLRGFSQSAGNGKWIFGTIQLSVPGKTAMWIPLSTKGICVPNGMIIREGGLRYKHPDRPVKRSRRG